ITRTGGTAPPLAKTGHRRIVQRHVVVEPPHLPTGLAQADAKFGLLAGNQICPIASSLKECVGAHQGIAAACSRSADGRVPFKIAKPVVDGSVRIALTTPAAGYGGLGVFVEEPARAVDPSRNDLAITIHKLDVFQRWVQLPEPFEPRVARSRGRKRVIEIE